MNGKPQVRMYETSEAKKYKKNFSEYIKKEIVKQDFYSPYEKSQHYYIDCIFYFDRINKDCNNYFKLLLDAITDSKCVWVDDNVVCERVNGIYYDAINPRIEMNIYPVDYIGIFDNRNKLDEFKSKCISCAYYRNGECSILKKSIEGRIQVGVSQNSCYKYINKAPLDKSSGE